MPLLIPRGDERRYDSRRALHLLNNGVPMGLQFSITAIGSIMLQSANNALGTVYVAAFTASMRVKYLFTCVFENIGVAMADRTSGPDGWSVLRSASALPSRLCWSISSSPSPSSGLSPTR